VCDPSEVLHKSVLFSYLSRHMSYSYTAIMCEYVSHIYLGLRSDHTGGGRRKTKQRNEESALWFYTSCDGALYLSFATQLPIPKRVL